MEFVDIAFPLKLGRLTYRIPEGMVVEPGNIVRAEVKKSIKRGIVLGPSRSRPRGKIKDIAQVEPYGLGMAMARLIEWMADYYFAPEGMVVKTIFPQEFFDAVKARRQRKRAELSEPFSPYGATAFGKALEVLKESVYGGKYRTFLVQAPSTVAELSFAVEAAKKIDGNIIISAPEHGWIDHIEGALREAVGETALVSYHAGINAGKRSESLRKMMEGEARVVLGGRYAVFAPIPDPALIIVMNEESPWYKEEGGVRYHARDMAVMRGYLGGSTVALSSISPSLESVHNTMNGKYGHIEIPARHKRPIVRVISRRPKEKAVVSRVLKQMAVTYLKKGEKVLIYINRKGFSILECEDCGRSEHCRACEIPMRFHKEDNTLRCGYCGAREKPPAECPSCGSVQYRAIGAGLERVEEEIAELNPVGVEQDSRKRIELISEGEGGLAVGTKVLTRSPELSGEFAMAGVINPEAHLYIPDFRSAERSVQDLMYVADRVRPGGEMVIQSRKPRQMVYSALRNYNFRRFNEAELSERKAAGYPPFGKLVVIVIEGGQEPRLTENGYSDVEILGPVSMTARRGRQVWKILLKAATHASLKPAVKDIQTRLKGRKFIIDVDPVVL